MWDSDLLLGPAFDSYTAVSFYQYVESLRDENFKKKTSQRKSAAFKPVSISINKKGHLIIRCKRQPKQITKAEIIELAGQHKISQVTLWNAVKKRDIQIVQEIGLNLCLTQSELPW